MVAPLPAMSVTHLVLAVVLAPLAVGACVTAVHVTSDPVEHIRAHNPSKVRLQLRDSSQISLTAPRVTGDSIVGVYARRSWQDTVTRRIPRDSVMTMFELHYSVGKTLGLFGGALAVMGAVSCASSSDDYC